MSHGNRIDTRDPAPEGAHDDEACARTRRGDAGNGRSSTLELLARCKAAEDPAGLELLARHGERLERFARVERAARIHSCPAGSDHYLRMFIAQDARPYMGRGGLHSLLARVAVLLRLRREGLQLRALVPPGASLGAGPEAWIAQLAWSEGLGRGIPSSPPGDRRVMLDQCLAELEPAPRQALMYAALLGAPAGPAAHWMGLASEADYLSLQARGRMRWLQIAESRLRAQGHGRDGSAAASTDGSELG